MLLEIEYSSLPVRNGEQALCQAMLTGLLDQNNIFPIEGIHSYPSFCYLMTAISVLVKKKKKHTQQTDCVLLAYASPLRLKIACLGLGNNSIQQEEKY